MTLIQFAATLLTEAHGRIDADMVAVGIYTNSGRSYVVLTIQRGNRQYSEAIDEQMINYALDANMVVDVVIQKARKSLEVTP